MKPLAAIAVGVWWLWLMAPTHDEGAARVLLTLASGSLLIITGLLGAVLKLNEACK